MKLLIIILCISTAALAQSATTQSAMAAPPLKIAAATILSIDSHDGVRGPQFFFQDDVRHPTPHGYGYYPGDLRYWERSKEFECRKTSGDLSTIVDLGERTWDQIDALPAQQRSWTYKASVVAGHAYLIHINDTTASDFWAIVRAVHEPEKGRCDIEWVRLDQSLHQTAPRIAPPVQSRLAAMLNQQDENVDKSLVLQSPRIVLQVRSGAGGGNPNRIDMLGETSIYVKRVSDRPLSFDAAPQMDDLTAAYFSGGRVPEGKRLVIRKVTYRGSAKGDTNGHGEFIIHIGRIDLIHLRNVPQIPGTQWEGRIELPRGWEQDVYLEVANSSTGDVLIEGDFVDR